MREAVFSSLGPIVNGARVLDLFAGSGAYGLEALSRGAHTVQWVEKDRRASQLLSGNLAAVRKSLGLADDSASRVWSADALKWSHSGPFDLIFVDPPYALMPRIFPELFELLGNSIGLSEMAKVCLEHPAQIEIRQRGWTVLRRLGKGQGTQPVLSVLSRD
jgi:16S rRNA (guanine966-N2)-methyltransferase